ncbi:MAG: hypothetical protein QT10_C0014G0013 [archaeon GW2011_AR19]|nr:MAG: hypothetical protein QT10_C0014G0013 [archaeon GW2011_AR19]
MTFNLINLLTMNKVPEIKDFPDLKKRYLKQKIGKLKNKDERIKIWQALIWLDREGVKKYWDELEGVKYLDRNRGIDCVKYAIGDATIQELIPGILEHTGNPEPGDTIIYGHSINQPEHMGVYQKDGTVISKWGDNGPLIKHKLEKIHIDFGKYFFFSTYKGKEF